MATAFGIEPGDDYKPRGMLPAPSAPVPSAPAPLTAESFKGMTDGNRIYAMAKQNPNAYTDALAKGYIKVTSQMVDDAYTAQQETAADMWHTPTSPLPRNQMAENLFKALGDMNRVAALPNVSWQDKINYIYGRYGENIASNFVRGGGMAPAKDFNTPEANAAFSSQLQGWQNKINDKPEFFGINGIELDPGLSQFLNVAGTIAGGVIGGPAGAAIGGGVAKLATGGDIEDAIKQGGLAYLGGQVAGGVSDLAGGGATGAVAGGAAAGGTGAALAGGDIGKGMLSGALSGGLNASGSTSTDLGGGLSVDASGNVMGGTPLGEPGIDGLDYNFPSAPESDAAPLGSGLSPSGGQQGLRIPPLGVSAEPGLSVAPDAPLGDPLSFINIGGTALNAPADFSLSTASGTPALRPPQAPNLDGMGGQGLTAPTNAKLGSPESFINSPEILQAVQAGLINENGMLPTGGAALGDPTSPINAGTFAQPDVEAAPGAVAAVAGADSAPAPQQAPAQQKAAQKAAPAPTRTLTNATVGKIINALVGSGAAPGRRGVTTPGATRAAGTGGEGGQSALSAPAGAPTRQEGQSDEQYAQSVVDYVNSVLTGLVGGGGNNGFDSNEGQGRDYNAGVKLPPGLVDLSAQHLADLGLKPGTPEYYEYIMSQFDDVIGRLLNGTDPNDAKFSSQLRAKTRGEQEALYRVLYARGVLDQLMGSGRYADPFTGREEDVIAQDGQTFNPSTGAYQRGLARSVDEMRGMSPQELRRYIGGMLSRNPDLFHMQAAQNARRAMEAYAADSGDEFDPLKRRGMLPFTG